VEDAISSTSRPVNCCFRDCPVFFLSLPPSFLFAIADQTPEYFFTDFTMKIQTFFTATALLVSSSAAFTATPMARPVATQLGMFGGAGAGAAMEDDPEAQAQIEAAAKSMNMSVDEYKLGMRARVKLAEELDNARVEVGNDKVSINRCANNPPKFMEITITDGGKAAGKEALSKELVTALKSASDASRTKRQQAQKSMMLFIQDEAKKLGM